MMVGTGSGVAAFDRSVQPRVDGIGREPGEPPAGALKNRLPQALRLRRERVVGITRHREPAAGGELGFQLPGTPTAVPGEHPRLEIGVRIWLFFEIDGLDAQHFWPPIEGCSAGPARKADASPVANRSPHEHDLRSSGHRPPAGEMIEKIGLRRAVEHDADGSGRRVLDDEHD